MDYNMDSDYLTLHTDTAKLKTQMDFVLETAVSTDIKVELLEKQQHAIERKIDKMHWILYAVAAGVASQIPELKYLVGLF